MKKTIGICLFFTVLSICAAGSIFFFWNAHRQSQAEQRLAEATESGEIAETEEVLESMQPQKPYRYLLVEENGVLIVYESDGETILLETNIKLHGLDETTKIMLKRGIPVMDEEELYDFLESYSS